MPVQLSWEQGNEAKDENDQSGQNGQGFELGTHPYKVRLQVE